MNIQTLIVASRTNLKENQKSFFDIRQQVTQFLIKIRNLVGENRIDGETVRPGLKSLQSLLSNHLSLPYVNFITLSNQKMGNLVSSFLCYIFRKLKTNFYQCTSSSYHLFHGHLEWRWLCLTMHLKILQNEVWPASTIFLIFRH